MGQQEQREAFDIHKYGTRVIEGMQKNQRIPFRRIACGKPIFQICRLFLATLQLVSLGLRLAVFFVFFYIQKEEKNISATNKQQRELIALNRPHMYFLKGFCFCVCGCCFSYLFVKAECLYFRSFKEICSVCVLATDIPPLVYRTVSTQIDMRSVWLMVLE